MPTYPWGPAVDFAEKVYSAVAPGQAVYAQKRINSFRNSSSLSAGAQALAASLGARLSPGGVATDSIVRYTPPTGQARFT